MNPESVVFTALPGGFDLESGLPRLTVFVSPRLDTDDNHRLELLSGAFPAFESWPATLAAMSFSVLADTGGESSLHQAADMPSPDPLLWKLLFGKSGVGQFTFTDHGAEIFHSFPVAAAAKEVLDLYRTMAEHSPDKHPDIESPALKSLRSLAIMLRNPRSIHRVLQNVENREAGSELVPRENAVSPGWPAVTRLGRYLKRDATDPDEARMRMYAEAAWFYDRRAPSAPSDPKEFPKPEKPDLDFHSYVAACADYPQLLRHLGLALDFLIDDSSVIANEHDKIRVILRDAPGQSAHWIADEAARPWTHFENKENRFIAAPRSRDNAVLLDGSLALERKESLLVNQIDLDGSILKLVQLSQNLANQYESVTNNLQSMTAREAPLPALRNAGFTISRNERARHLVQGLDQTWKQQDAFVAGEAADLYAEDINRGYRLDVLDWSVSEIWHSLHRRVGEYRQGADGPAQPLPVQLLPDEAFTKETTAAKNPDDATSAQFLHETIMGWEGWSLAAGRPGKIIGQLRPMEPEDTPPSPPADFPLITRFRPEKGSLPRLRFGHSYQFRIRAVDLGGWSLPEALLDRSHESEPETFYRYEPVPSPTMLTRRQYTEGESLMRMVIRSTLGVLPSDYVAQGRITGLDGHTTAELAYLDLNERHIAPPIGSQQLAELHGRFDPAIGGANPAQIAEQFAVASRESGSFMWPGPGVIKVSGGFQAPLVLEEIPEDPPNPNPQPAPLANGEYLLHDVDTLVLPYLPDPLAAGASFTRLPGDTGTRLQPWESRSDWSDQQPFRLRIVGGTGTPVYDGPQRLLTVFLPQAELVTVNLSSYLEPAEREKMGLWTTMKPGIQASEIQQKASTEGRHWMLTPWSRLTLVHAVEKPLLAPEVQPLTANPVDRLAGETFAAVQGSILSHAKSTGRLDVEARWTEDCDDVQTLAPDSKKLSAHVGDFLIESDEDAAKIGRIDTPRWKHVLPQHRLVHEFSDTRHRNVQYHAVATTRFREYFPPKITDDAQLITHEGPPTQINIPSSRRPEPPEIQYVIPTWTWTEQIIQPPKAGLGKLLKPTTTSTRSGGGLRVYLSRPWYSSGDDELLGVVLPRQSYLNFPVDLANGLSIDVTARIEANEVAERAFTSGLVRPGGRKTQTPAERFMARVLRPDKVAAFTADRGWNLEQQSMGFHLNALEQAVTTTGSGLGRTQQDALTAALAPLLGTISADAAKLEKATEKYVTRWGSDPAWGGTTMDPGPFIHQFPLRSQVGTAVSLLEVDGGQVTVVGHKPAYDATRKLWYCDIQLDMGTAYYPFVDLALVRYQPDSLPGLHISQVVRPEFVQLVPERTAAITNDILGRYAISLWGPSGYNDAARTKFLAFENVETSAPTAFVEAQLETLPDESTTDLAWATLGDSVRLAPQPGSMTDMQWHGLVPAQQPARPGRQRMAIREFEYYPSDEDVKDASIGTPGFQKHMKYRLVYAKHFEL